VLVAGPTGVGKTLVGTHFIAEGLSRGESGVIAVFEEHPDDYLQRAKELGFDLEAAVARDQLRLVYLRPLDLSVDETLLNLREAIDAIDARRFVIDSLTGFELAMAPHFREDFRDALYRMVGALTGARVTTLMIVEVTEHFHELSFSPHSISFLTENIILLRYVEIDGLLQKVVAVVKMRRSSHTRELRAYDITDRGLVVTEHLRQYQGLLTGAARPRSDVLRFEAAELTPEDARILAALSKLGPATAEQLAATTGAPVAELMPVLRRLVVLAYVLVSLEGDVATYHPIAASAAP
jgi:circadian clock protein KaiC